MKVGAICITKSYDLNDFKEWLEWHISHCKFHKVFIFDNESSVDIRSICAQYSEVEYESIKGRPDQYAIYDKFVADHKDLDWFIPIDDDEYFWFDPEKYSSISEVIERYQSKLGPSLHMLAVRWKFGWPADMFKEYRDKTAMKWCTNLSDEFSEKIVGHDISVLCKTLVKNDGRIHYQTSEENPNGGHIPRHSKIVFALSYKGQPVFNNLSLKNAVFDDQEDIRILHLKYKSYSEFKNNIRPKISGKTNKLKNLDKRILKFLHNKNANA